jgi:hypothetical protein
VRIICFRFTSFGAPPYIRDLFSPVNAEAIHLSQLNLTKILAAPTLAQIRIQEGVFATLILPEAMYGFCFPDSSGKILERGENQFLMLLLTRLAWTYQ